MAMASSWSEVKSSCEAPRRPVLLNRRERKFFHVGCNRWRCPGCARRKSQTVQKRMLLMQPTHMLTFSLPRTARAVLEDLVELHGRRRVFFRWLQRQPWGLAKYGWVLETGELNGQLHAHTLVRMRERMLPYALIQKAAKRVGLGVPDFQPVWRKETAARYVAKYIAKGLNAAVRTFRLTFSGRFVERANLQRRFGMSNHLMLAKNPDWSLATIAELRELPVPWSHIWLVLATPMFAIPAPAS